MSSQAQMQGVLMRALASLPLLVAASTVTPAAILGISWSPLEEADAVLVVEPLGVELSRQDSHPNSRIGTVTVREVLRGNVSTDTTVRVALPPFLPLAEHSIVPGGRYMLFLERQPSANIWTTASPFGVILLSGTRQEKARPKEIKQVVQGELLWAMHDPAPAVRVNALKSMTRIGDPSAMERARRMSFDPDDRVSMTAIVYRVRLGDPVPLQRIRELAEHGALRSGEPEHLVNFGIRNNSAISTKDLEKMLLDESVLFRRAAAYDLSTKGQKTSVPLLFKALSDEDHSVRQYSHDALRLITRRKVEDWEVLRARESDLTVLWSKWLADHGYVEVSAEAE